MSYLEFCENHINNPEKNWIRQTQIRDWHKQLMNILSKDETNYGKWFIDGRSNLGNLCLNKLIKDGLERQNTIIYD